MTKPLAPKTPRLINFKTAEATVAALRASGVRMTTCRRLLLEAIFETHQHRTAEQLAARVHEQAPDVHVSTIYRNLEDLERLGVLRHTHLGHGPATYQLAHLAHAHFVCTECGARLEVPVDLLVGLTLGAHDRLGFTVDPGHFPIGGRCVACA